MKCPCGCGKDNPSKKTILRHLEGKGTPRVKANHAARLTFVNAQPAAREPSPDTDPEPPRKRLRVDVPPPSAAAALAHSLPSPSSGPNIVDTSTYEDESHNIDDGVFDPQDQSATEHHAAAPTPGHLEPEAIAAAASAQQQTWAHSRRATVEDCSDDDDENRQFEPSDDELEEDEFDMFGDEDEEDELSVEDRINEEFEQELAEFGMSRSAQ